MCTFTAEWLVKGNVQPKVTETKFVYRRRTDCLGIAQINVVSVPGAVIAKTGIQRRIGGPVRVDSVVLIAIVVGREQTKMGVGVDAAAVFVISEVYFSRARRERPGSGGGINGTRCSWKNEWQQFRGNGIEAGSRQCGIREHALHRADATWRVIRLVGCYRLSELLR